MNRRAFTKTTALLSLFGLTRVQAKMPVHDFSSDEGLRLAIESLFSAVDPVKSQRAWEHLDYPHVTFCVGWKGSSNLRIHEQLRSAIFESVKNAWSKEHGRKYRYLNELGDCTLCWRMYPQLKVEEDKTLVVMRASWWRR